MTTITIRPAKPLDTSNLIRLLIASHEESGTYPPVDHHMGLRWVTRTLSEGYAIVADVSGRLVGTLAVTNYNYPWSPEQFMYLEWLFVQKKFRTGGVFNALMKALHAFADEHDSPILAGISAGGKDVFLKDRLIQIQGYQYIGGDFIRSKRSGIKEKYDDADVQAAIVG